MVIAPSSAADSPNMMPPSICAVAVSVFTTSPQSTAAKTRFTLSAPSGDTDT